MCLAHLQQQLVSNRTGHHELILEGPGIGPQRLMTSHTVSLQVEPAIMHYAGTPNLRIVTNAVHYQHYAPIPTCGVSRQPGS